jgi:hypothetical protein
MKPLLLHWADQADPGCAQEPPPPIE